MTRGLPALSCVRRRRAASESEEAFFLEGVGRSEVSEEGEEGEEGSGESSDPGEDDVTGDKGGFRLCFRFGLMITDFWT